MKDFNMACMYGVDFSEEGLRRSLSLIKKAIKGEQEAAEFYGYLCRKAPNKRQKEIINSIRCDEVNHKKWFKEIYCAYTGKSYDSCCQCQCGCGDESKKPKSYREGLRKAVLDELSAMEQYRLIRSGLPNRCYRDLVFQILTDEIKHAIKINFLLNELCCRRRRKYKCRGIEGFYVNPVGANVEDIDDLGYMEEDIDDNDMDNLDDIADDLDIDGDNLEDIIDNAEDHLDNDVKLQSNDNKYGNEELMKNISPLVDRALEEEDMGINSRYLFSKFILSGALVGKGEKAEDALNRVEKWHLDENSKVFIRNNM